MPAVRTHGSAAAMAEHAAGSRKVVSHIVKSWSSEEAEVDLLIIKEKRAKNGDDAYVVANLPRPSVAGLPDLPAEYRMRCGIETGHRDVKRIRPMTVRASRCAWPDFLRALQRVDRIEAIEARRGSAWHPADHARLLHRLRIPDGAARPRQVRVRADRRAWATGRAPVRAGGRCGARQAVFNRSGTAGHGDLVLPATSRCTAPILSAYTRSVQNLAGTFSSTGTRVIYKRRHPRGLPWSQTCHPWTSIKRAKT